MKVLFVVKSKAIETLGAMYLASVVKKAGHEALIVELNEDTYHIAHVWGADIVGMSIMTGDMEVFKKLGLSVKNRMGMTVIVGGPDPTFFPQGYEWADHIVRGEGENWMADFLASKRLKTDAYPDIDSIPWPDRTDFPGMKIRDFISSRGCPFNCAYCYTGAWAKMFPEIKRVRTRSVEDVLVEINSVDPAFVYFQDSCFGVDIKWLRKFSRLYEKEINIPFHCHLRPDQVKEERVMLLREAGCYSVRIALETASKNLRKLIGRERTSNEETVKASWLLRKWNIKLMIQNILGIGSSTIEDDLETLEINIRCKPEYGWCSIFQPYPGTKLGEICIKEGWYSGDFSEITDCFFDGSVLNFSEEHKEQLVCLQRIFALAVETETMPDVKELTYENFPKLVHRLMRRLGDKRLYGGII